MADDVQVKFGAQTSDVESDIDRLRADFKQLFTGMATDVRQMSDAVQREMREVSQSMDRVERDGNRMGGVFASLRGRLGGLFAGFSLAVVGREVINTTVEFERLRSVLFTLEGEASGARFEALKEFATETPYDLQQVVKAFSFLKSQGLDPGNEALRSYGNTASAMSMSLDAFVQAVGDAAVGEMERLKEFGILARQQGDQVTFMFRGVATTVGRNSQEIQEYLRSLGDVHFAGAMERQMDTLGGSFSNLGDAASTFMDEIGQGGLSGALGEIASDMSNAASESGGFATMIGEGLGQAILMVWDILQGFGSAVSDILGAVGDVIGYLAGSTADDTSTMRDLWYGLLAVINGFGVGVRVIVTTVGGLIRGLANTFVDFARVVERALAFDFSGAVAAFNAWRNETVAIAKDTAGEIVKALAEGKKRQDEIIGKRNAKPGEEDKSELPGYNPPDTAGGINAGSKSGRSQSVMSKWRDELEARIRDEAGFFKDSLDLEIDFWRSKLGQVAAGSREEAQLRQQIFQLEKRQAQDGLRDQLQILDNRQAIARDDLQTQLAIQDEKLALLAQTYGEDSREYRAAAQEKIQIERQLSEEMLAIAQERISLVADLERSSSDAAFETARMNLQYERELLQGRVELGEIGAMQKLSREQQIRQQELALEIQHENNLFQIKANALRARLALEDLRPQERRRVLADIELMEAEHQNTLAILNQRAARDIQRAQQEAALSTKQRWMQVVGPIGQSFDGFLSSMLTRSQTFNDALIAMGDQVLSSFISMGVQMAQQWIANELAKTAATSTGATTRAAVEGTAAAASAATSAAAGLTQITTNAAVGASGAFAATAPIPFVGPALAPGAAAAALAAILGFGGMIASARGGFDIPSGVNPMTQLHEEEMVLPANLANPLRESLRGAGVQRSRLPGIAMAGASQTRSDMSSVRGGDTTLNYQPSHSGSGGEDFKSLLRRDANSLRRWIRNEMRNGSMAFVGSNR